MRLWAATAATADEAAIALIDWVGTVGSFDWFVLYQESDCNCVLLSELTNEFHIKH